MTYQVLFVCTGNICRSPLGEVLLRAKLADENIDGVDVLSAGTGAWEGTPASEGALLVALEHGLDLSAHKAQLLTRSLIAAADLVLTMSRHHRARVGELGGEGKTYLLGEYAGRSIQEAEVADPYGSDLQVYRETFTELGGLIDSAVKRLTQELPQ